MLSHYGLIIGITLVVGATFTALVIGARAAKSIENFRSEDHRGFEADPLKEKK